MDKNRKIKWDKAIKGRKITTTYGENYIAGDDTKGLFQQTDDGSWTPVSVEQARDIYVPNVTDPVSNSYTQLGPMPTLTVTSPDWETSPYSVYDTRFGGMTPITTINVRKNKNTGKILPEDYKQVLAIKDWYAKEHPKSDPSENFLNDLIFTAATLGANKNIETATKGISSLFSNIDPIVKTAFRDGIAKPMLLGSLVDQIQKAVTGTSLSDQIGSWLTNDYGWNPYVAHFVGDLTNPGYTMPNFTGQLLTKGVINPIINGINKAERNIVKRQLIKELDKSISRFDGTVGEEYFHSPNTKPFAISHEPFQYSRRNGYRRTFGDFIFTPPLLNKRPSIWQRIFKYKPHPITVEKLEKEAPGLFSENELSWMRLSKQERNKIMTNAVEKFYENNIYHNLIRDAEQFGYTKDIIPKNVFYGKTSLGNNFPLEEGYFPIKGVMGAHSETSGHNYISGEIVRWSPRFVPYKLMQLWDKSRGTSIKNIRSRYIVPQKTESISTAVHEAGSHGTDNLTIYNQSPFGKSLYDALDFRVRSTKGDNLSPWEIRATINEFKFKNPNWREMTFDDFIRNKQAFMATNGYSGAIYRSAYLNKRLDRLYNAIMNTYATGGKLENNTTFK